jgi:Protein of unknown function (DUF3015)
MMEITCMNTLMKRLVRSSIFLGLAAGSTAAWADDSNGCGIGWVVFKDKSLVSSSLRQTTNGVAPNTFSMTSGTSGCARHSIVYTELRGLHFVESNGDALEAEIASGHGNYLESFALTLGCPSSVTPTFAATLRQGYNEIYGDSNDAAQTPSDVYAKIRNVLRTNNEVQNACPLVSTNIPS